MSLYLDSIHKGQFFLGKTPLSAQKKIHVLTVSGNNGINTEYILYKSKYLSDDMLQNGFEPFVSTTNFEIVMSRKSQKVHFSVKKEKDLLYHLYMNGSRVYFNSVHKHEIFLDPLAPAILTDGTTNEVEPDTCHGFNTFHGIIPSNEQYKEDPLVESILQTESIKMKEEEEKKKEPNQFPFGEIEIKKKRGRKPANPISTPVTDIVVTPIMETSNVVADVEVTPIMETSNVVADVEVTPIMETSNVVADIEVTPIIETTEEVVVENHVSEENVEKTTEVVEEVVENHVSEETNEAVEEVVENHISEETVEETTETEIVENHVSEETNETVEEVVENHVSEETNEVYEEIVETPIIKNHVIEEVVMDKLETEEVKEVKMEKRVHFELGIEERVDSVIETMSQIEKEKKELEDLKNNNQFMKILQDYNEMKVESGPIQNYQPKQNEHHDQRDQRDHQEQQEIKQPVSFIEFQHQMKTYRMPCVKLQTTDQLDFKNIYVQPISISNKIDKNNLAINVPEMNKYYLMSFMNQKHLFFRNPQTLIITNILNRNTRMIKNKEIFKLGQSDYLLTNQCSMLVPMESKKYFDNSYGTTKNFFIPKMA